MGWDEIDSCQNWNLCFTSSWFTARHTCCWKCLLSSGFCNIEAAGRGPDLAYRSVKQHIQCVLFSSLFISFGCPLDTGISQVSKSFTWCFICKVCEVKVKLLKCPSSHDMPQPGQTDTAPLYQNPHQFWEEKYPDISCFIRTDVDTGLQIKGFKFKVSSQAPLLLDWHLYLKTWKFCSENCDTGKLYFFSKFSIKQMFI